MHVKVKKWGQNFVIRIPQALAWQARLTVGSGVSLRVEAGKIIIEPDRPGTYSLDELLKGVTSKNLHPEAVWGKPAGREVW